ncbi:TPA: phage protein [Enterobacter roggenkampii]
MIITDIKELIDSENAPPLSKSQIDYLSTVFTYEYLKMSGVIDNMRMNGQSEAFINGYIEGVYSALQTIEYLSNPHDDVE